MPLLHLIRPSFVGNNVREVMQCYCFRWWCAGAAVGAAGARAVAANLNAYTSIIHWYVYLRECLCACRRAHIYSAHALYPPIVLINGALLLAECFHWLDSFMDMLVCFTNNVRWQLLSWGKEGGARRPVTFLSSLFLNFFVHFFYFFFLI